MPPKEPSGIGVTFGRSAKVARVSSGSSCNLARFLGADAFGCQKTGRPAGTAFVSQRPRHMSGGRSAVNERGVKKQTNKKIPCRRAICATAASRCGSCANSPIFAASLADEILPPASLRRLCHFFLLFFRVRSARNAHSRTQRELANCSLYENGLREGCFECLFL